MTFVAFFLVNAALAFALSLVLAALLGPDAFGRYAIGTSIAIVINTVLFEWLRLSTSRFQSERTQDEKPVLRRTLDLSYWASAVAFTMVAGIALVFDPPGGLSRPLLAAAAACGIAYGFCEYRIALSRALFRERSFIAITFLRALLGFVLAAGLAYATGDPVLALVGTTLAAALPLLAVRQALRPTRPADGFDREALARFARYAVPLVAANALYQLIPLLNRGLLAGRDGFVEAGYFSLVSELATRLFQNLGAALDIALFQLAVRADEQHGREAAERQIARNAAIVVAIVMPAALGLWVVWPSFEAIFVPQAFRGHLIASVPYLIPALGIYALIQFALNPFFQMRHRTGPVVAAALAAVAVNVAAVLIWPRLAGAPGFALAQLAGLSAGFLVMLGLAISGGARLPWRDIAISAVASGLMTVALLQSSEFASPLSTLAVQVAIGASVYGVVGFALDLCGCRGWVSGRLGRPAARLR